jgi:hypothetical protein
MTVVLFDNLTPTNECDLLCEKCKRIVGKVQLSEVTAIRAKHGPILCFACEGSGVDLIPQMLVIAPGDRLVIYSPDAAMFLEYHLEEVGPDMFWKLTPSSRLGLSSSPYLPQCEQKTRKNGGCDDTC